MTLTPDPMLPFTVGTIYLMFAVATFSTFLVIPYNILRYFILKKFLRSNRDKCVSKLKTWLFAVLALPLTTTSLITFIQFIGDDSFLGFFIFIAALACFTFLSLFLKSHVAKLEQEAKEKIESKK